jgi:hypothetical protein
MTKINEPSVTRSRDEDRPRQRVIEQCLAALGRTWATSWCLEMATASRSIEGGWPGRLAEARSLAQRELTRELAARGMAPPSPSELASAPVTVNNHARKEWLQASKTQRSAHRRAGPA